MLRLTAPSTVLPEVIIITFENREVRIRKMCVLRLELKQAFPFLLFQHAFSFKTFSKKHERSYTQPIHNEITLFSQKFLNTNSILFLLLSLYESVHLPLSHTPDTNEGTDQSQVAISRRIP
jgi:hypothetical protein